MSALSTPGPSVERIVRARVELGWTQEEAAREAGISVVTLGKWERRERIPSGPFLRRYAKATRRDIGWFFTEDGAGVAA